MGGWVAAGVSEDGSAPEERERRWRVRALAPLSLQPTRTTSPRVSWRTTEASRRWAAAASLAAGAAAEGAEEADGAVVAWGEEERERGVVAL